MKHYAALSLIAVLLVSGCAQLQGVFGSDVLTINRKVSEEGLKDILLVREAKSIPTSPVLPGQPVLFSIIVENIDKTETAKNAYVDLFNAPLVKNFDSRPGDRSPLCNQVACQPDICRKSQRCEILPGEQRSIEFRLLAPTEDEIARIKTDTELSYKVFYSFRGNMLYTVPAVNQKEIEARQRQGQAISLSEQVTHGSGPVQIDVQLFGTPYLLSGFSGTFIFNVKNKGKGNVVNSEIAARKLVIEFPVDLFGASSYIEADGKQFSVRDYNPELPLLEAYRNIPTGSGAGEVITAEITGLVTEQQPDKLNICKSEAMGYYCQRGSCAFGATLVQGPYEDVDECNTALSSLKQQSQVVQPVINQQAPPEGPRFDCRVDAAKVVCVNARPIQLFRDETRTTLRFKVSSIAGISEPFKTYLIRAYVDYDYELRSSFPLTVRPFEK